MTLGMPRWALPAVLAAASLAGSTAAHLDGIPAPFWRHLARRYWEDMHIAVGYLVHGGFPVSSNRVVVSGTPGRGLEYGEERPEIAPGATAEGIRPWEPWRVVPASSFAGGENAPAVRRYDDAGRPLLLGLLFRALGGVSPYLIFWLGAMGAVPLLLWASWEAWSSGHAAAGTAFVLMVGLSSFVSDALSLAYSAVGFHVLGLLALCAFSVYAALGRGTSRRGFVVRVSACALILAVCTLCRGGSLTLAPGFVLASGLAARRVFRPGPARGLRSVVLLLVAAAAPYGLTLWATRCGIEGWARRTFAAHGDAEPVPQQHVLWFGMWTGLGDFDRTKGYCWRDSAAWERLEASGQLLPLKFDSYTPAAERILRDQVLRDIREDPAWYVGILARRLASTFTLRKLWPWGPLSGAAFAPSEAPNEGVIDQYYRFTASADVFGGGLGRGEIPIQVLLWPVWGLLALCLVRRRGASGAEGPRRRGYAWALACVAVGALPLPVLVTTAGALETQAFVLFYLLGAAFVVEEVVGRKPWTWLVQEDVAPLAAAPWRGWRGERLGLIGVLVIVLLLGHRLLGTTSAAPGAVLVRIQPWNVFLPKLPTNELLGDVVRTYLPIRGFVNASLRRGEFPLWNPYVFAGHPAAADPNSNVFYPVTIALGWLSAGKAHDLDILFHLLVAASGTYVLVRRLGGAAMGALAATIAFAACSSLTVWQQFTTFFGAAVWLPWLLLCFELAQGQGGRRLVGLGCGGIVLGLVHLANLIQWTAYDFLLLGCYAAWLSVAALGRGDARGALRPWIALGLIGLIGFGIGAVQLLPLWELFQLSDRHASLSYAELTRGGFPFPRLLSGLAPDFFGNPTVPGSTWGPKNYAEGTLYWGFYPLVLAVAAPLWRRDRIVWFLWTFLWAGGSIMVGSPTIAPFLLVPGLNALHHTRMAYVICFVGAVLCGLVFDALFSRRERWKDAAVLVGLAALGRGVLELAFRVYRPLMPGSAEVPRASLQWVTAWVVLGLVAAAVALLPWSRSAAAARSALLVLVVLDLARFSLPYNRSPPAGGALYPVPEALAGLPDSIVPPRVAAIHEGNVLFLPSTLLGLGRADVGGYDSLVRRDYREFMNQLNQDEGYRLPQTLYVTNVGSPLLDLLGAEYLASLTPLEGRGRRVEPVAYRQWLYLYRNLQAAPRAFVVGRVKAVGDREAAWSELRRPDFDHCRSATVEAPEGPPAVASEEGACVGSAVVTRYENNVVELWVVAKGDGLVVLTDAYYPGWKATVDGAEEPVLRADGVFRGVRVVAGQHSVRFLFRPWRVSVGLALGAVSLAVAAALVVAGRRQAGAP